MAGCRRGQPQMSRGPQGARPSARAGGVRGPLSWALAAADTAEGLGTGGPRGASPLPPAVVLAVVPDSRGCEPARAPHCHAPRRGPGWGLGGSVHAHCHSTCHTAQRPVTDTALGATRPLGDCGLSFSSSKVRTMSDVHSTQKQQKQRTTQLPILHPGVAQACTLPQGVPRALEGCVAQSHRGHSPRLPWTGPGGTPGCRQALGPLPSEANRPLSFCPGRGSRWGNPASPHSPMS